LSRTWTKRKKEEQVHIDDGTDSDDFIVDSDEESDFEEDYVSESEEDEDLEVDSDGERRDGARTTKQMLAQTKRRTTIVMDTLQLSPRETKRSW
jgi:hypothetical protein